MAKMRRRPHSESLVQVHEARAAIAIDDHLKTGIKEGCEKSTS